MLGFSRILIIGKKPLPIGGVTVHVERLAEWLDKMDYCYDFYDLNRFSIKSILSDIFKHKYIHLHTSSPIFRFLISILCKIFRSNLIITYHGNIGRYNKILNLFDCLSIFLSYYPIVLNERSYEVALKWNKRSLLQSAYLPIVNIKDDLSLYTKTKLQFMKDNYQFVLCTNAFNWSLDKNGDEIYCISFLVRFFSQHTNWALIISDPSGNCKKQIKQIPENILFVDYPHTFINVLQQSDCFLRYTLTDGDSLSVHEAISFCVPVIATDVVSRPNGVLTVRLNDANDLECAINSLLHNPKTSKVNTKTPDIIQFYLNLNR